MIAADRVEVSGADPKTIGLLASERAIPIFETSTQVPDLEDIFFNLTSQARRRAAEDGAMSRLVRVELLKLRTVRTTYGLLVAAALLTAFLAG